MTTAIAQFMRELERLWDEHREASVARRDLAGALAHLAAEPSVWHLPAKTGAAGRPALERFYAEDFLPHRLIRSQRIHWDHATLARQLGIPGPPSA